MTIISDHLNFIVVDLSIHLVLIFFYLEDFLQHFLEYEPANNELFYLSVSENP